MMHNDSTCLFCKIVAGDIPAEIIYQDPDVLAFNDLRPQAPIHKLIIPKQHIATINDIDDNNEHLIVRLFRAAKTIAADLNVAEDGYRVVMNCNQHGGQEVYHIHLHLLAGRQMIWPPG